MGNFEGIYGYLWLSGIDGLAFFLKTNIDFLDVLSGWIFPVFFFLNKRVLDT